MTEEANVEDRYQQVAGAWARVYAEFNRQKAAGRWDEERTNALAGEAHEAFDLAVTIVPQSLTELQSYLAMLEATDIRESPESVETALIIIGKGLDILRSSFYPEN